MSEAPSLIDKTGMGGIIAIDGFDYQRWDAICRIPAWLKNAAFEGLTVEALEDFEARFFSPHAVHGHVLERFQAKSGHLTRGEIVEVFENFKTYDTHYPNTALIQTLVTPALPTALRWLERDAGRIERARRFYQPFTDITDANDRAFQTKLEAELDLSRFDAAPSIAFTATKEIDYGTETEERISPRYLGHALPRYTVPCFVGSCQFEYRSLLTLS